jgi:1-acyl-sn-glycerol-3-phosphate acyltransferase
VARLTIVRSGVRYPPVMASLWEELRSDFPGLEGQCYLNAAAASLTPRPVREAVEAFYREQETGGDGHWEAWLAKREAVRGSVARFIGAEADEIAFVPNTSTGINLIADLLERDGPVLTDELEFPTVTLPWMHRGVPVRFVAKSDIRRWPLVGFLVSGAGTIFIERSRRKDTARTNRAIVEALTRGEYVAMFPEGATTDGTAVKPFHASLFQPALSAGARVVVVALRYVTPDGNVNLDASYVGERSLWQSIRLILAHCFLHAELTFAATIDVSGKTRRDIARAAESAIADALRLPRPGRKTGPAAGPRGVTPTAFFPTDNPYPARSRLAPEPDPALTSARR